eukprot:3792540-Rhodomonas_salina.1
MQLLFPPFSCTLLASARSNPDMQSLQPCSTLRGARICQPTCGSSIWSRGSTMWLQPRLRGRSSHGESERVEL